MENKKTIANEIKKYLGIEKLASSSKEAIVGNLRIEQIIKIAEENKDKLFSNTFKGNMKTIAGICLSCGVLIEGKNPKEIIADIDKGLFDEKINNKKNQLSNEEIEKQKQETAKYKEIIEKIKQKQEEAKAQQAKK